MARKRRGRGEGGVYERADGRWVGSLSLGFNAAGKRVRKTVYGATKQEAQAKLREIQQKHDAGNLPDSKGVGLGAWLTAWLGLIKPMVEPRTHTGYKQHVVTHITPRIGHMRLSRIRPSDVESFYGVMLGEDVSAALVRKIGTTLTVALNHATRSRLIPSNPATGVRKPKATRPTVEILDPSQAATFAAACRVDDAKHGALFLLLLDSAIRPGEALALTWPDIDLARGRISITKALEEMSGKFRVKKPKTKRAIRQVDISEGTVEVLSRHRAAMLKAGRDVLSGIAFCSSTGGHLSISNIYRDGFHPMLQAAGIPAVGLYALRHTCATLLLLADVNPKIVSERLGHSSITLTLDTYSHVLPTMQRAAADVMGKLLGPATKAV